MIISYEKANCQNPMPLDWAVREAGNEWPEKLTASKAMLGTTASGYEQWSRARASHGRSTSSTGNQSANVGYREGDFGFSPDSGRE